MGTRSGDIDPTAVPHVAARSGRSLEHVEDELNRASGLRGLCGDSDVRTIESRIDDGDETADLALDVFCYRVRKYVGAYLAALGRCDAIVFTGGIGEHSSLVRSRSLAGLDGLGVELDPDRNARHASIVSTDASPIAVVVMPTDEEAAIARHTAAVVAG